MTGIERLNACFKAFPEETKALLHHWILCPPGMEDHVIHRELADGTKMVSVTGLLNATIMADTGKRLYYVVTADKHSTREEELASIECYGLIPESAFRPDNTVPVPELGTTSSPTATNKDRYAALLEVVEFAKSKGFPGAEIAFWDPENGEEGYTDIEEVMMDHDYGTHAIEVGVYLHKDVNFQKTAIPETADTDAKETFEPAEGLAP